MRDTGNRAGGAPADRKVPVRQRLLAAGKELFAAGGYENTTTAAIAREAATSESQLVKHFGGKEGLLQAIFQAGWERLNRTIEEAVGELASPRDRLVVMVRSVLRAFESDPDLKSLMLLEGRRIHRGGEMVQLTRGYEEFIGMLDDLLQEMRAAGELRADLPVQGVRSALVGALESLLRDHMLSRRIGFPAEFGVAEIRDVFDAVLAAFVPSSSRGTAD